MKNYIDILASSIRANWDRSAVSDFSHTIEEVGNNYTYGEMYARMVWLNDYFDFVGIKQGDHIAVCGVNSANWVIAYLAIARYHAVSVTFIHRQTPESIEHYIDFSDSRMLFIDKEIWTGLHAENVSHIQAVIALDDFSVIKGLPFREGVAPCSKEDVRFDCTNWDDVAQICFTSGTTTSPKGVMMTYRNLSASVECAKRVLSTNRNRDAVSIFPLGHIIGLGAEVLVPLALGNRVHYVSESIPFAQIAEGFMHIRPYQMLAVPMLVEKMMTERFAQMVPLLGQFLDYFVLGGASLPKEVSMKMIDAGLPLTIGYGMTETSLVSIVKPIDYKPGSVGRPIDVLQTKISPSGEILVRGENVMLGYYKNEAATREKIDSDGWLHTGDRGHIDEDGYLYVEGRLEQDMIVLPSGENVHPENIEAIINKVAGVEESLVLARDGKLIALVRKKEPVHDDERIAERNQLLSLVNPQLPAYAQLFGVEFISEPLVRTEKKTIKRYLYN